MRSPCLQILSRKGAARGGRNKRVSGRQVLHAHRPQGDCLSLPLPALAGGEFEGSTDYEPAGVEEPLIPAHSGGDDLSLNWTPEARERVERIPLFLRRIIVPLIERKAKEEGLDTVTPEFLERIRRAFNGGDT